MGWDKEIKKSLLTLIADVQNRKARIGDLSYDTLIAAYSDLMNSKPDYGYVRFILAVAMQRFEQGNAAQRGWKC